MRKNRFDAQAHATLLGSQSGIERSLTGKMNDVARGAGIFKKSCEPPSALGFNGLRPAGLVPLRPSLTFRDELRLKPRDQLSIFAVRRDDHAELFGERKCLIHFAVIDAKEIFVREKNFE